MNKKTEYYKYMKQVTDGFIDMQSNLSTKIDHDSGTGYKSVIWNGGLDYTMEHDGSLYLKGVTAQEMRDFNAKTALKYLFQNALTYDEWLDLMK